MLLVELPDGVGGRTMGWIVTRDSVDVERMSKMWDRSHVVLRNFFQTDHRCFDHRCRILPWASRPDGFLRYHSSLGRAKVETLLGQPDLVPSDA